MNTKTQKPAYLAPRTTRTLIRIDVNLCTSTYGATVEMENMNESDYDWEI